jgi:hypothetical protein
MQRIAVATERADDELPLFDRVSKRLQLLRIGEEHRRIAVRVPGIGSGTNLDRFDAQPDDVVESFLEGLAAEEHRKDPNLHSSSFLFPFSFFLYTLTQRRVLDAFAIASITR